MITSSQANAQSLLALGCTGDVTRFAAFRNFAAHGTVMPNPHLSKSLTATRAQKTPLSAARF